jgi:hypothetical protein
MSRSLTQIAEVGTPPDSDASSASSYSENIFFHDYEMPTVVTGELFLNAVNCDAETPTTVQVREGGLESGWRVTVLRDRPGEYCRK